MSYGMKDASDLIMIDLATGIPSLFIDYANATSSEWTAESVYATKKGTRAIRWDDARQGTLTLDTELFDFGLLAMVMGSKVKRGQDTAFTRSEGQLTADRTVKLDLDGSIDEDTISVIKLDGNTNEHIGLPLANTSNAVGKLPAQVKNVTVSVNDKTAKVAFSTAERADSYNVFRAGEKISEVFTNEFSDTGLTAEAAYEYKVVAVNTYGVGPESPVVKATTSAEGVTELTPFNPTTEDTKAAEGNAGEVNPPAPGDVTYTYANGVVTLNENALPGERYVVYFMENVESVRKLTIGADAFPGNYEIYANSTIKDENDAEELVQIHYKNAKPQSNFTLTQSATEPTSLSIVFDLFPDKDKVLAEMKVIK